MIRSDLETCLRCRISSSQYPRGIPNVLERHSKVVGAQTLDLFLLSQAGGYKFCPSEVVPMVGCSHTECGYEITIYGGPEEWIAGWLVSSFSRTSYHLISTA